MFAVIPVTGSSSTRVVFPVPRFFTEGVTFEREIVLLNCNDCLSELIIT